MECFNVLMPCVGVGRNGHQRQAGGVPAQALHGLRQGGNAPPPVQDVAHAGHGCPPGCGSDHNRQVWQPQYHSHPWAVPPPPPPVPAQEAREVHVPGRSNPQQGLGAQAPGHAPPRGHHPLDPLPAAVGQFTVPENWRQMPPDAAAWARRCLKCHYYSPPCQRCLEDADQCADDTRAGRGNANPNSRMKRGWIAEEDDARCPPPMNGRLKRGWVAEDNDSD